MRVGKRADIQRVKISFRLAPLVLAAVAGVGCSGNDQTPDTSGKLTVGQEASAKALGITTPGGLQKDGGQYSGDINQAQRTVQNQNNKVGEENAAIDSMAKKLH